jgi:predicted TPR repeat methyltransferase
MNRQQRRREAKAQRKAAGKARAAGTTNTKQLFESAKGLKQARKFGEAEALYRRIVTIEPNNWEAHNNLGNLLADRDELAGSVAAYQRALAINPHYAEGHSNLGSVLRESGDLESAVASYRRALELNADHAGVHFNLGTALIEQGKPDEGETEYRRAAELGHEAARYMLDSISGKVPETAPREYVTNLFDDYAAGFEENLVSDLDYRAPELLRSQLETVCPPGTQFINAVDLGCGSGLAGIQLRPMAARLTGVDLSAGMLGLAEEKEIYDELVHTDIVEFLESTEQRYDLFMATDLFIYVGNLEPVFSAVRGVVLAEAWFTFSTESTDEADYKLNDTGRYSHSKSYIELLSKQFGFTVRSCEMATIRKQNGHPVPGHLFVLHYTSASESSVPDTRL